MYTLKIKSYKIKIKFINIKSEIEEDHFTVLMIIFHTTNSTLYINSNYYDLRILITINSFHDIRKFELAMS